MRGQVAEGGQLCQLSCLIIKKPTLIIKSKEEGELGGDQRGQGVEMEDLNIIFYFYMSIVIIEVNSNLMEVEEKNPEEMGERGVDQGGQNELAAGASKQKKQISDQNAQEDDEDDSEEGSGWSSEVIEPAIKTMQFRPKRGTRMKELIRGKPKKDLFWEKYQCYFGGNINGPEDQDDLEDYQASSSGRDEFDSDFDLTDSYVGKRGRKKGTKVKRKKKPIAKQETPKDQATPVVKGRRGRKKKVVESQLKQSNCQQQNNPDQNNQIENKTQGKMRVHQSKSKVIDLQDKKANDEQNSDVFEIRRCKGRRKESSSRSSAPKKIQQAIIRESVDL